MQAFKMESIVCLLFRLMVKDNGNLLLINNLKFITTGHQMGNGLLQIYRMQANQGMISL